LSLVSFIIFSVVLLLSCLVHCESSLPGSSLPYLAASTGAKRSPSLWFLVFLPYFTYRTGFSGHPPCLSLCLQPFCSHCFTPRSLLCPVYSLVNKKNNLYSFSVPGSSFRSLTVCDKLKFSPHYFCPQRFSSASKSRFKFKETR